MTGLRHEARHSRRGASGVRRFLRKRHVCGAGPLGDRSLPGRCLGESLPGRSSGDGRSYAAGLVFSGTLPGVGRFLRKRHFCGADRSEIGPYLGGAWARAYQGGLRVIVGVVPRAWCSRGSCEGRAISPKAPCLRCGPLGDRSLPRRCLGDSLPGMSSGDSRSCAAGLEFSGELRG